MAGEVPAFQVPRTGIRLTFDSQVASTGGGDRLLWIARRAQQARGVVITVSQMLRWTLQPKASDAQLPLVTGQLALRNPEFRSAIGDADFFAANGDYEFVLPTEPNDWKPTQRRPAAPKRRRASPRRAP